MSTLKWKKALAVCLAILSCAGFSAKKFTRPVETIYASTTIAELEARKQENNKKILDYENQLARFSENQKQEQAYQVTLQDKIDVLQNNMLILDTELETIKETIFYLQQDITDMEAIIAEQQENIDAGLEEFKLRLRAMYINGNDSLASALVGATDFYDLLSKYELISCVAKHDDELVSNLKQELEAYDENLVILESQKAEQEQAQADKKAMQSEMKNSMQELQDAYADSQAEQERLALEKDSANKTIAQLEADNQLAEQAEAEIREQIRRAEEERKRKEAEEARKKATATSATTIATTASKKNDTTATAVVTTTVFVSDEKMTTSVSSTEPDNTPATAPVILTKQTTTSTTTTSTTTSTSITTTTTSTTTTTEPLPPETAPAVPATMPPTEAPAQQTTTEITQDYDASAFSWPCPGYYYISSGFGTRWGTTHKGMDIAQNAGADAVASRAGKVIKINTSCKHNYGKNSNCCGNGYGNYVLIDHEDGTYSTMYAHLETVLVSVGEYVEKGQTIGYVGTTGYSTGYHLHFEIRKDGTAVNPSSYLNY